MRVLKEEADYETHETHECNTTDYEDHTFSGIMFTVETTNPTVACLYIESLAIRGELGPITVWAKEGGWRHSRESPDHWRLVFKKTLDASTLLQPLEFDPLPVTGQLSLYVHSALRSDTGIVYDNFRTTRSDAYLTVHPGCAHLSPRPFSGYHPWGAWRNHRVFVGKIKYSVRHLLWRPQVHSKFPSSFKFMVLNLCLMRKRHPFNLLSDDIFFYLLHMCPADWCPLATHRTIVPKVASTMLHKLAKFLAFAA